MIKVTVSYLENDTGDVIYHTVIPASTSNALSRKIRSRPYAPLETYKIKRHRWTLKATETAIICYCYRR